VHTVLAALTLGVVLVEGALERFEQEEAMKERYVSGGGTAPWHTALLKSLSASELKELVDRYEITPPPGARAKPISYLASLLRISTMQLKQMVESVTRSWGSTRASQLR
jgi:hypothetical protein